MFSPLCLLSLLVSNCSYCLRDSFDFPTDVQPMSAMCPSGVASWGNHSQCTLVFFLYALLSHINLPIKIFSLVSCLSFDVCALRFLAESWWHFCVPVLWDFWSNHDAICVFLCFDLLRAIFEQSPEGSYYCILGTEERSHGPSMGSIQIRASVFRQQRALICLVCLHVEIFFLEGLSESFLGFILLIFNPFVLS